MKKVLLYSGGLDSVIANYLWKPDILLYIDSNSRYSPIEKANILLNTPKFRNEQVIIDEDTFDFFDMEKNNLIVPFRNLYYILRALEYGQIIYLGANKDDISPDKDEKFIAILKALVMHMTRTKDRKTTYCPRVWRTDKFDIQAPSIQWNKTELVAKALEEGIDPEILRNIRTCYDEESKIGCGKCYPCVQKEVALRLNGITAEFDNDPVPYVKEFCEKFSTSEKHESAIKIMRTYLEKINL